ncbi:MAG: M48 family metallopeptidase [Anaerolineae bacterium]
MPRQDASKPLLIKRGRWTLRVIQSARRKKTISAKLIDQNTLEIRAPAHVFEPQILKAADTLIARTERQLASSKARERDAYLEERARILNERYFDGKLSWTSIRFVTNQRKRFGSCTPDRATIRISDRLCGAPAFVLDYVVLHELAHLTVPNHSAKFWDLVNRFPKAERARGYLMAMQHLQADQEDS